MNKRPSVEQIKQKQKTLQRAYKNLFETAEGKVVLEDLNERFYDVELFVRNDSGSTLFNNGMRECVRHIRLMAETTTEDNEDA